MIDYSFLKILWNGPRIHHKRKKASRQMTDGHTILVFEKCSFEDMPEVVGTLLELAVIIDRVSEGLHANLINIYAQL